MRQIMAALLLVLPGVLRAEAPRVVTDIAPVHGLVAMVMDGVGAPDLLMREGAAVHGYAMRPSEAAALEAADLLVWIGPELTPWLDRARSTLGATGRDLALLDRDNTLRVPARETAHFGAAHAHDDGHGHEGTDPHAWLDPANASVWLGAIAEELAGIDPANAATYRANAAGGLAMISATAAEVSVAMRPMRGLSLIVTHDALQYFERAFGLTVVGALTLSDDLAPSARHMAELTKVADGVGCVLAEPGAPGDLIAALFGGDMPRVVEVDPLGRGIEKGRDFYPALLRRTAEAVVTCRP